MKHHPPAKSLLAAKDPKQLQDMSFLLKLDRPWKIIKNSAKLGIGGVKRFTAIMLLFTFINMGLIMLGIYRLATVGFTLTNVMLLLVMVAFAVVFVFLAGYKAYKYLFTNILANIYDRSINYRINICEEAIIRSEKLFSGQQVPSNDQLKLAVDWGRSVYAYYGKIPPFFQSGITQALNRVPVTAFLVELKEDMMRGNTQLAAEKLRFSLDAFINDRLFAANNTRWLFWLLPLNMLLLLGLAFYGFM